VRPLWNAMYVFQFLRPKSHIRPAHIRLVSSDRAIHEWPGKSTSHAKLATVFPWALRPDVLALISGPSGKAGTDAYYESIRKRRRHGNGGSLCSLLAQQIRPARQNTLGRVLWLPTVLRTLPPELFTPLILSGSIQITKRTLTNFGVAGENFVDEYFFARHKGEPTFFGPPWWRTDFFGVDPKKVPPGIMHLTKHGSGKP